MSERQLLRHDACPKCPSSDALAVYDDGYAKCFAYGCGFYTYNHDGAGADTPREATRTKNIDLIQGSPFTASVRGISTDTFNFWKYVEGEYGGERVHIAQHFNNGQLIGQKIRTKKKKFSVLGKLDALYGRWLWPTGGKRVVVTEGELDALSVSQAQYNKWPVVSIPNGAQGAAKSCREAISWLSAFDEVVFLFDGDEPGQEAAVECAKLLPPGKAKIATLPLKDANEMLKEGRERELITAIWNAAEYRPDGIVTMSQIKAKALTPIEIGHPWFFPTLTQLTYGRRLGETYFIGAGTGIGKTDVLTEQIAYDMNILGLTVGGLFLEQDTVETTKRVAGKMASKRFHVPDGSWTSGELADAIDTMESRGRLFLYDNFGATEWDAVKERIEYLAMHCGCTMIYLDHLTALAAAAEDERTALEKITAELAMLAKRLRICLVVVSHLSTPESGSHEEGARVTIRQFKGSRAIGFWAHFMFGLERDQQTEDEAMRNVTTFRVLKDRYTGQSTGKTFNFTYDHATGRLSECVPGEAPASTDDEAVEF